MPSRPRSSDAEVARLRKALADYTERVDRLDRELSVNIKRIAVMQAEINHLRAMIHERDA